MLIGIDAHNLEGKRTGVGRYLFNLLKEWAKPTTDYRLPTTAIFILYFKDEIPNDLPKSDLFEFKLLKVGSTAKFIHWDLWRAAKKDKVDFLFCPAYIGPLFYKGNIALMLHDISYEVYPEWFNWPSPVDKILLKWVSKKTAKKAKVIFVPVDFVKREVVKYYNVSEDKVIVTGEGVDSQLIGGRINPADLAQVKTKFGIKDKFIFYVGSIFSRRHLLEVIRAFRNLEGRDYQLLLGGRDYTEGESINKLVGNINKELGRQAILRVDFIGDSDLKLLYSACAFFIWLSDYEGFGLPVLEAMAAGAPVITSDKTSLKEVAGSAALLIKNNFDTKQIYETMRRLMEGEGLRQDLINRGKEQAAKFSWGKCAKETLNALLSA